MPLFRGKSGGYKREAWRETAWRGHGNARDVRAVSRRAADGRQAGCGWVEDALKMGYRPQTSGMRLVSNGNVSRL
eukprot:6185002-Pleurochrysis_carterae.AAC.1